MTQLFFYLLSFSLYTPLIPIYRLLPLFLKKRNRMEGHTQTMEKKNTSECKFQEVLAQRRIFPYLQPIVQLNTQEIVGYEALARFFDQDKKPLSICTYIDDLEKSGEVMLLDLYMFEEVCKLIQQEEQKRPFTLKIWSNFSRHHFKEKHSSKKIIALLKKYTVKPSQVGMEITEYTTISLTPRVSENVLDLTRFGIALSIDDFGEGISTPVDLEVFQAKVFKVDRSMLCQKSQKKKSEVIQLLAFGKQQSIGIIIEGVETQEQVNFLKQHYCEWAQGYYFYPPMPPKEAFALIQKSV